MIKLLFLLLLIFWPQSSQAGFLDNLACVQAGNCGLEEVVVGLVFLIRLMLGGMGAVALLYFVIGGMQWLTSAGSPDKVRKGREIMMNTALALILAFSSYVILDFFVNRVLGVKSGFSGVVSEPIGACGQDLRAEGQACLLPEINMVCYNKECISECAARALQTKEKWECKDIATATPGQYTENVNMIKNLCPGKDRPTFVCVKD